MCRLGGLIQLLGELKVAPFFRYFGFMRFRAGRGMLHVLNGIYCIFLGRTLLTFQGTGKATGGFMVFAGAANIVSGAVLLLAPCAGLKSNTSGGGNEQGNTPSSDFAGGYVLHSVV